MQLCKAAYRCRAWTKKLCHHPSLMRRREGVGLNSPEYICYALVKIFICSCLHVYQRSLKENIYIFGVFTETP